MKPHKEKLSLMAASVRAFLHRLRPRSRIAALNQAIKKRMQAGILAIQIKALPRRLAIAFSD
jgi:hypothetical protein